MGHACHAKQYSDQMICHRCGLVWDVNDPEPPACNKGVKVKPEALKPAPRKPYKRTTNR